MSMARQEYGTLTPDVEHFQATGQCDVIVYYECFPPGTEDTRMRMRRLYPTLDDW